MAEKITHNNISLDKAFQIIEYLSLSNIPAQCFGNQSEIKF